MGIHLGECRLHRGICLFLCLFSFLILSQMCDFCILIVVIKFVSSALYQIIIPPESLPRLIVGCLVDDTMISL